MSANSTRSVPGRSQDGAAGEGHTGHFLQEPLTFLLLLLVCLCAVTILKPDADFDVWHRLALGKLIYESGAVPRQDTFSYSPGTLEWVDHEWGAAVVFYWVASLAGQKGLLLLKAFLMFGTLGFIYLRSRRTSGRPPSLVFHVLLVGALAFGFLLTIRAQAFTFFLFSAWLYLLERARDGDWRLTWLIPVSGLAWANLHGGSLAGVGLVLMFGAGELLQRRPVARFGLLAAASGLATLVNPYGFRFWTHLFEAITKDRATIVEWQPLDLLGSGVLTLGFKVLLVATLVLLATRGFQKKLPDFATVITLIVTAGLGLRVMKHMSLFVIASAPFVWTGVMVLCERATRKGRAAARLEALYYWLGRGLLLLVTVFVLATAPMRIVLFESYPVRALDFIEQNRLRGNLLVPFNLGSYAIWRLYPDCRVAMDGRYDAVYAESTFRDVRGFFHGDPGWSEFLDRLPHDILLIPRREPAAANMAKRGDWAVAHEDKRHRVFVRSAGLRAWPPLAPPAEGDPFSTADKPSYVP